MMNAVQALILQQPGAALEKCLLQLRSWRAALQAISCKQPNAEARRKRRHERTHSPTRQAFVGA